MAARDWTRGRIGLGELTGPALLALLAIFCVTPASAVLDDHRVPVLQGVGDPASGAGSHTNADAQPESPSTRAFGGREIGYVGDPEGDALEKQPQAAQSSAGTTCWYLTWRQPQVSRQCDLVWDAPASPVPVGVPARPELDLLSVRLAETPTHVVASFEVASLPDDPMRVPEEDEEFKYELRLGSTGDDGTLTVAVDRGHVGAFLWGGRYGADWNVPFVLEPGSPGFIHAAVPRAFFEDASGGYAFDEVRARTVVGVARWEAPCARGDVFTPHGGHSAQTRVGWYGEVPDYAPILTDVRFTLPMDALNLPNDPVAIDAADDSDGGAYEMLSARILENATHVGFEMALAHVGEEPAPYYFGLLAFHGPTRPVPIAGTFLDGGERRTWSVLAEMSDDGWTYRLLDVAFEVEAGDPGIVRFSWLRTDIGNPSAGTLVSQAEFMVWTTSGVYREVDELGASASADLCFGSMPQVPRDQEPHFDYVEPFRPYYLATDPAPLTTAPLVSRVDDAMEDVVLPPDVSVVDASYAASVDITFVEVKADRPAESRVAVGIRDLGNVRIPAGYDAVVYAAAVATADGPFMAVYYRSHEVKEFFCAPDLTVFPAAADKRNPYDAIWTPIQGSVAGAPAQAGGGSGAIVFRVPNTCFGEDQGETLSGAKLAAGTYLVRQTPTGTTLETLDQVSADLPVVLGAASAPGRSTAANPWYDSPLGIGEFWNILGVGLAMAGGAVVLATKRHHRSVLARQLHALDEAHAAHRADPAAWRRAMVERRKVAAELLRHGRLRPEDVVVVERRVELLGSDLAELAEPAPVVAAGAVVLDRYRVERLLGEGGQGRAFLARDATLQRDVVLKTLPTSGLDTNARRMIMAEARLAAGIKHPNVVSVLDVRETGADPVLILEYLEGGSLRGLVDRRGALPVPEAVRLMRGMLAGLAAAHERGVVHRDVKPENVLLAPDGTPKLADFGAARDMRPGATAVTRTSGTLPYMSPEQVRGAPADARSDLYSAGAVFIEMLTGAPYLPLDGLDQFQARAMILEKPPDLRLPDAALALTGFALKSVAKGPAERYASAREMLAALNAVVEP